LLRDSKNEDELTGELPERKQTEGGKAICQTIEEGRLGKLGKGDKMNTLKHTFPKSGKRKAGASSRRQLSVKEGGGRTYLEEKGGIPNGRGQERKRAVGFDESNRPLDIHMRASTYVYGKEGDVFGKRKGKIPGTGQSRKSKKVLTNGLIEQGGYKLLGNNGLPRWSQGGKARPLFGLKRKVGKKGKVKNGEEK